MPGGIGSVRRMMPDTSTVADLRDEARGILYADGHLDAGEIVTLSVTNIVNGVEVPVQLVINDLAVVNVGTFTFNVEIVAPILNPRDNLARLY